MKLLMLLLLLLGQFLALCSGRRMSRCEVVRDLRKQDLDGFEGFELGNFVCLAFWESKWKTNKVHDNRKTGSDYGIFQISSSKWCDDGTPGGLNRCNVRCAELLNVDLKASADCLKVIVKNEGLKTWKTWDSHCNGSDVKRWTNGCN